MKCTILDYGTGNIQSVHQALAYLGHDVKRVTSPSFDQSDVVVFPGQGSFGPAIQALHRQNLLTPLQQYIQSKRPFIGICLGFQLLFNGSEESVGDAGIGAFDGHFKRFTHDLSVPHMGWNQISTTEGASVLNSFQNEYFYFVHSYYLPLHSCPYAFATTDYGHPFVSAMATPTQLITQFHPEKSGDAGLALLDSFFKEL